MEAEVAIQWKVDVDGTNSLVALMAVYISIEARVSERAMEEVQGTRSEE